MTFLLYNIGCMKYHQTSDLYLLIIRLSAGMLCYPCSKRCLWLFILHFVIDLNTHNFDQRCPEDRLFNLLNKKSWKALNGTEHLLQHYSILLICMSCSHVYGFSSNATLWRGHWLVKRPREQFWPPRTGGYELWEWIAAHLSTTRSVLIGNCAWHHACLSETSISHLVLALKVLSCQDASNSLKHRISTAISAFTMSQGVTSSRGARYYSIVEGHTQLKLTHTYPENDARKRQSIVNTVNTLRLNFPFFQGERSKHIKDY